MGKLRDSLTQLSATMVKADELAGDVCSDLQKLSTQAKDALDMVNNGYGMLHHYVAEKYKKQGDAIGKHGSDTLKSVSDSNVITFMKGIEQQRPVALRCFGKYEELVGDDLKKLLSLLEDILGKAEGISGVIAKKKKRWLQSKKFKDKMKLYESQLEGIVTTAKAVKKEVEDSASDKKISGGNEDKYTKAVSESTTMAELSKRITIGDKALMSFNTSLERSRKIRERNHFGTQVANVKKWLAEADEMEAEGGPG